MARRPRRNHSPAFNAKVAVASIKGERTLIDLAQDFDVHPNQIGLARKMWRAPTEEPGSVLWGTGKKLTLEFRHGSVRLALTSGGTRRAIAEDLGIGLSTLTRWLS